MRVHSDTACLCPLSYLTERTSRWLDQLDVPAMLEAELRRPPAPAAGSGSARSHGNAGGKAAKPAAAQLASPSAPPRREQAASAPQQHYQQQQQQQHQLMQQELQYQPAQQPTERVQRQGLFSCFSCTTAAD